MLRVCVSSAFILIAIATSLAAQSVYVGLPDMDECVERSAVRIEPLQDDMEGLGRLAVAMCSPLWIELSSNMSGELKAELEANYVEQATRVVVTTRLLRVEGNQGGKK